MLSSSSVHKPPTNANTNQSSYGSPSYPRSGVVPQPRSCVPSTRSRTTSSLSAPPSPSIATRALMPSPHSSSPSPPAPRSPYQQRPPSSPLPTNIPSPKLPSPLNSPLQFDMKRLLSKPAPPYARSHGYGSGSESEGTNTGKLDIGKAKTRNPGKGDERPQDLSLPTPFDIDIDTGSPLDLDLDSFGVKLTSSPKSRMTDTIPRSKSYSSSPVNPTPPRPQEPEKRPRNVLKRRPSAYNHISTTTPTTTNRSPPDLQSPDSMTTGKPTTPNKTSPMTLSTTVTTSSATSTPSRVLGNTHENYTLTPSRAPVRTNTDPTKMDARVGARLSEGGGGSRTPIYSALATSSRGGTGNARQELEKERLGVDSRRHREGSRSRSRSRNPGEGNKSLPLTPAGAVVEAYKRQEEARRNLSVSAGSGDSGYGMYPEGTLYPAGGLYGRSESFSASESALSFNLASTDGEGEGSGRSRKETGFDVIERVVVASRSREVDAERRHRKNDRSNQKGEENEDSAGTPYYTVLGSTSGKVVAVGGPDDIAWDGYQWDSSSLGAGVGRRSISTGPTTKPAGGLARTLSRKVSGRWRRAGEVSGGEEEWKGFDRGRPSLQERRVGRFSNVGEQDQKSKIKNRRSLRLSIDKFVDDEGGVIAVGVLSRKESKMALTQPLTPLNGTLVAESEGEGDAWGRQRLKSRKSDAGGNKIWKLVKRISTGGLRDKYNYVDADEPPPVPALPKDYHLMGTAPVPRSADGHSSLHQKEPSPSPSTPPQTGGISRFIPTRSSSAGAPRLPNAPTRRKSSVALAGGSKGLSPSTMPQSSLPPPSTTTSPIRPSSRPSPSNTTNSTPNPRPSTTTRSSSPGSSDVASSRFFHRQSSTRSSTSSLFGDDDPPPMPKPRLNLNSYQAIIGQHIIPPSELHRLHSQNEGEGVGQGSIDDAAKTKKLKVVLPSAPRASDDWTIIHTPAVELASLPIPPRRPPPIFRNNTIDSISSNDRSESPIIPAFSTTDPINTFMASSRRASTDTKKSKQSPISPANSPAQSLLPGPPPPRPSRSSYRPPPNPVTSPMPSVAPEISTPKTSTEDFERRPEKYKSNRRSSGGHSNASTARPTLRRRSSSFGSSLISSPPRKAMTFRELGPKGEKQVLTEQEKADKWDDLLERSARAGGTLHLGGGGGEDGLHSDRLRFSVLSEIT